MSIAVLKTVALIFMIFDHIGFFFPNFQYSILLRIIGRIAAPIFFFCFVEGYTHTHNKKKYKNRLMISAILMMYLNIIMICVFKYLNAPLSTTITPLIPNMFFTFCIIFEIIDGLDNKKYIKLFWLFVVPFLEYNFFALASILVFKYVKNKKKKCSLFILINGMLCLFMKNYLELFMIFSVVLFIFYNGERGNYSSKFFYIIYPLHFYLLAFLHYKTL